MRATAKQDVKRVQIGIKVVRADGREEDLGIVSDSSWRWRLWGRRAAARRIHEANERLHA